MSKLAWPTLAWQETVWAARRVLRSPRVVLVGGVTIALAVTPGLIFRLVDRAVLPPLPFDQSGDLIAIRTRADRGVHMPSAYPKLQYMTSESQTLDIAAVTEGRFHLRTSDGRLRLATGESVTPNFFEVLRVRPLLGRFFREDENAVPFGHPVVVISERVWREHYGARRDVIGQPMVLNDIAFTIVGVVPRTFAGFMPSTWRWLGFVPTDLFVPAMMAPVGMWAPEWQTTTRAVESASTTIWMSVGRLRAGHSLREARAEVDLLNRRIATKWPARTTFDVGPLQEDAVNPDILQAVYQLKVAGGAVLLLGGVNLVSLLVARTIDRRHMIAMRALLGASRLILLWTALAEALFVAVAGSVFGVVIARFAIEVLGRLEPSILTSPFGMPFDPRAWQVDLRFALSAAASATGMALIAGIVAAHIGAPKETSYLRVGMQVTIRGLRRLRLTRPAGMITAAEVGLAIAVTVPALLVVRGLQRLVTADLGFRSSGVVGAELRLPTTAYSPERMAAFVDDAVAQLRHVPGVESATWMSCLPVGCPFFTSSVSVPGSDQAPAVASVHIVAPDAFRTLGIRLVSGRDFGPNDRPGTPPTAILTERAARQLGMVGSKIDIGALGAHAVEVVGIVADVPYGDLAREPIPAVYLPLSQRPRTEGVLVVRSSQGRDEVADSIRRVISSMDPHLEAPATYRWEKIVEQHVGRFRAAAVLLTAASGLALLLAAIGVYGLVSSLVSNSVREIAVRLAVGATPASLTRHILAAAIRMATAGALLGIVFGVRLAGHLQAYLYGVKANDTPTLLAAGGVATLLGVIAGLEPARRASHVDAMVILRSE